PGAAGTLGTDLFHGPAQFLGYPYHVTVELVALSLVGGFEGGLAAAGFELLGIVDQWELLEHAGEPGDLLGIIHAVDHDGVERAVLLRIHPAFLDHLDH